MIFRFLFSQSHERFHEMIFFTHWIFHIDYVRQNMFICRMQKKNQQFYKTTKPNKRTRSKNKMKNKRVL